MNGVWNMTQITNLLNIQCGIICVAVVYLSVAYIYISYPRTSLSSRIGLG